MKAWIGMVVVALAAAAFAHDHHDAGGKQVTITGTVVDSGCYMSHAAIGEKHIQCATACARNGVPLAIVDAAGKMYLPVAADHQNQNAKLMPFIEKKVRVTGTAMEKGGLSGVAIKTVEAAR